MLTTKVTNLPGEKWAAVEWEKPTLRKNYAISNMGRIKTIHKLNGDEALILGSADRRGYLLLNVRLIDGEFGHIYVHRFVAEHFVKKGKGATDYILHHDRNRRNNRADNLKWASKIEWKEYVKTLPTYIEGRRKLQARYKLDDKKVAAIRKRLSERGMTLAVVAKEFGVSITQVYRIKANENWRAGQNQQPTGK